MATITMIEQATTQKAGTQNVSDPLVITTETANAASEGFDTKSALEIARIINAEDAKVAAAVKKALPEIAIVIDTVARALRDGGRLIYVGAGSSGRISSLDASECPANVFDLAVAGAVHHGGRPEGAGFGFGCE